MTDDEINAEVEKMAAAYGMEADKLKEYMGDSEKESIARDLKVTKAVDLIMENVKERAKAKTKKEKKLKQRKLQRNKIQIHSCCRSKQYTQTGSYGPVCLGF